MNLSSSEISPNPYDELPYLAFPIEWTAPEHLALASLLHDGPRVSLERYRVLELGCAALTSCHSPGTVNRVISPVLMLPQDRSTSQIRATINWVCQTSILSRLISVLQPVKWKDLLTSSWLTGFFRG